MTEEEEEDDDEDDDDEVQEPPASCDNMAPMFSLQSSSDIICGVRFKVPFESLVAQRWRDNAIFTTRETKEEFNWNNVKAFFFFFFAIRDADTVKITWKRDEKGKCRVMDINYDSLATISFTLLAYASFTSCKPKKNQKIPTVQSELLTYINQEDLSQASFSGKRLFFFNII